MDTIKSLSAPTVHAGVVTNPDGSNIGSTVPTGASTSANQTNGTQVTQDEDDSDTIAAWTGGTYTTAYVSGSGVVMFDTTASFPFRYTPAGYININDPVAGTESEGINKRFYNVYQILIPTTKDVDSQKYRMVMLQPQKAYISLATAQAEDVRSLSLGTLSASVPEFVIYARITYSTSAGYANTGKVVIATGGVSYISGSKLSQISVGGFTPSNHNDLTGLQGGTTDEYYHLTNADYVGQGTGLVVRKSYVDSILGDANALVYRGVIDCSTNPNYPAADAGHLYIISVAGKIGGASGIDVEVGDMAICNTDTTASGDQATVGVYWNVIQKNIVGAVVGPASSTDGNVAIFDGTTGKTIKDSGLTLSGTNTGDETTTTIKTKLGAATALSDGYATSTQITKLDGIEAGAEVNNISDVNATDLTDSGDSALHYHSSDRNRANHTGTQIASTISDFDTEVSNNTSVVANTAKVTNATHTGEVSGSTALTITDNVVTEPKLAMHDTPANGEVIAWNTAGYMEWVVQSGGVSSGATLPVSAVNGDIFIHTPTGRTILMGYDGTNWVPITSLGSMTVYVNGTSGTDSQNGGTGTGASAFATIQFAINQIPGLVGGNVNINVASGTYAEDLVINGKNFSGDYSVSIVGTLTALESVTSATVSAGTGATQGTVTKTGQFTGDVYANKLVYFATDNDYKLIDSHTNNVLTLVITAPSSTTQNVTIYDWATKVQGGLTISNGQTGIYFYNVNFDSFATRTMATDFSKAYFYRCAWTNPSATIEVNASIYSYIGLLNCYVEQNSTLSAVQSQNTSFIRTDYTKIYQSGGVAAIGANILAMGALTIVGTVIGGFQRGIYARANGFATPSSSATDGYTRIRNCTTGILADTGGQATSTSTVVYSGNTADETATAASYGYID